jgi:acyl-CoA thioesterase I
MNGTARSRRLRAVFLCLLLTACAFGGAPVNRADVLVMGDSIMTWNRTEDAAVSDALSRALDRPVATRAVPGASVLPGGDVYFAGQIPDQLPEGRWDWIVLNGGANDLQSFCGCNRCDAELDRLISEDGSRGAWPDLLSRVRPRARRGVVIVGYYGPSRTTPGSLAPCADELKVLDGRLARLAARTEGLRFADVRPSFTGPPEHYAPDRNHPSPRGSAVIASLVAREIREN